VLLSAGFDAHAGDPLAGCELQNVSFARMARLLRDAARGAGVPLGAVLEGGYRPALLGECVSQTLAALGGEGRAQTGAPVLAATAREAAQVGRSWPLGAVG